MPYVQFCLHSHPMYEKLQSLQCCVSSCLHAHRALHFFAVFSPSLSSLLLPPLDHSLTILCLFLPLLLLLPLPPCPPFFFTLPRNACSACLSQPLGVSSGDVKKKKETKLGLAHSKQTSFGDWYSEVVVESEMISYYDVSGKSPLTSLGNMLLVFFGNIPSPPSK